MMLVLVTAGGSAISLEIILSDHVQAAGTEPPRGCLKAKLHFSEKSLLLGFLSFSVVSSGLMICLGFLASQRESTTARRRWPELLNLSGRGPGAGHRGCEDPFGDSRV